MNKSIKEIRTEIKRNDPSVMVNQIWSVIKLESAVTLRRIRILAPFPDPQVIPGSRRNWIFWEFPARMNKELPNIGVIPEFNLRYVFRLEGWDNPDADPTKDIQDVLKANFDRGIQ